LDTNGPHNICINSHIDGHFSVDNSKILNLVHALLNRLGIDDHEVSIALVDPETMRGMNRQYRGKDRSTDVLSFPQKTWTPPLRVRQLPAAASTETTTAAPQLLGDIVISAADAAKNAEEIGQGLDREFAFLIVHGLLHLCGHDHHEQDEEREMLAQQDELMAALSAAAEPPLWQSCIARKSLH